MGGLAHAFEREGVATTQISLIRLHTEKVRPPRALWVPFPLGRPFGPPGVPAFQRRVVRAALDLLVRRDVPVLEDFPDESPPDRGIGPEGWSCPVSFADAKPAGGEAGIAAAVRTEVAALAPWFERARGRRGRTTFGASGLAIAEVVDYLAEFEHTPPVRSPRPGIGVAALLRLAVEDLKAFYLEAAAAQPGPDAGPAIKAWFWRGTAAAQLLWTIRARCMESADEEIWRVGALQIVPEAYASRPAEPG